MRFKGKLVFSKKPILAYDHLACMKRRLDENLLNDTVIPVFTLFYFTLFYFIFLVTKEKTLCGRPIYIQFVNNPKAGLVVP